jgi:hypothetical protein
MNKINWNTFIVGYIQSFTLFCIEMLAIGYCIGLTV